MSMSMQPSQSAPWQNPVISSGENSTLRTARQDKELPFGLTGWSFTFPVGTCVTGTIGLAARTGADLLRVGAAGLFLLLLAAWLIVAIRTVHGGASGSLFLPAAAAPPK